MEHQDQHPLFLTASEDSLAFNLLVCAFQRWHLLRMPHRERELQGHQQAGKYMRLGKFPNCAKGPQVVPKDIFLLVVSVFRRQYNHVVGQKTFKSIIECKFEIGKSNKRAQIEGIFICGRWLFPKVLWRVKLGKQEFLASGRLQDDMSVVLSKCQTDEKRKGTNQMWNAARSSVWEQRLLTEDENHTVNRMVMLVFPVECPELLSLCILWTNTE